VFKKKKKIVENEKKKQSFNLLRHLKKKNHFNFECVRVCMYKKNSSKKKPKTSNCTYQRDKEKKK
jgi:hypothetical protein